MTDDPYPPTPLLVATRRLTVAEVETQQVRIHPDLAAVDVAPELALAGGGTVRFEHGDECSVVGPAGWLDGLAAGDVVVLRVEDEARLTVSQGGPDLGGDGAGRLARALREAIDRGDEDADEDEAGYDDLAELVDEVRWERPELFAEPDLPLSETLGDEGLVVHGDWVGIAGVDWERVDERAAEDEIDDLLESLQDRYGLTAEQAVTAVTIASHADPSFADLHELSDAALAELLDEELTVPMAVLDLVLDAEVPPAHLAAFAERLRVAGRGPVRAAASWLGAAAAELAGDRSGQEHHLKAALGADPEYPLALLDASWYASDRGQASAALSLLRRAGRPDDGWTARLASFAAPGPMAASGRNDPCPCGSGRKYKACCAPTNGWPVDERLGWLYDKAVAFLHRPGNLSMLAALGALWGMGGGGLEDGSPGERGPDPALVDLAMFECGVFDRFLEARGPLLPADELAVAQTWPGRWRSVYEVLEVRAGEGLTLRDEVTGAVHDVRERTASRSLQVSQLVLARLLPTSTGELLLWGSVTVVPPDQQDEVLGVLRDSARSPRDRAVALATWLGRLAAEATGSPSLSGLAPVPAGAEEALAAVPAGAEEALAAAIAAYEASWVEEPVPALGGLTPREAMDDPAVRTLLERLLASFDDLPGGPGTMDADRLRGLLGLPPRP